MSKTNSADSIYATKITQVADFRFDAAVARVFTDMVNRSIPSYADLVKYIGLLAQRYVQEGTRVYDLGCSLGAVSLSVDQALTGKKCDLIALDSSAAMLEQMQHVTQTYNWQHPITLQQADAREFALQEHSFAVMNFVLQFLPPTDRQSMLDKIYVALLPRGAFILSEKVKFEGEDTDSLICALHHDFKRSQGYSDMEIVQKRNALEEAMKIDTVAIQIERLHTAGFSKVIQWFQAYNFVSFLALK